MTSPFSRLSFCLYQSRFSRKLFRHLNAKKLLRIPGLFARAEDSGAEGCYVEIAKWNRHSRRYERFAFEKFFGGELWADLSAELTAARVAAIINIASESNIPLARTGREKSCRFKGERLKCKDGSIYRVARPISVRDVSPYEFASVIHSMPCWNPSRVKPTA